MRNWLLKLLGASPTKTATAKPTLPPGRCPECSGLEVAAVLSLKSWAIALDGSEVIETHIGNRYACQRCPCIYSVSPTGVFRHHQRSSPLTPEVPREYLAKDEPDPNGVIPPQFQRPIPKRAPSV